MHNNQLQLKRPWAEVKELLKEVNHELVDADLEYKPGGEDALLERLSVKMGRTKEEVRGWIESVATNERPAS
jgi:hypothetical protein